VERWRGGGAHDVYRILQGFIKSVAWAIRDSSIVKHEDGRAYIDLFCIPQWFYDEVMNRRLTYAGDE
jgi:hypothetical protein